MYNLPSEKIVKIHEPTGSYMWNDYVFDLSSFSPSSWSLGSSNLAKTIEKAATNYHCMGRNFSRMCFKNEPVQTNSNHKGNGQNWGWSSEK
jgi:hypothetical protein